MVLTANKDSPKSQTGLTAGSLEFSDHSYFCAEVPMFCRPLCAKRASGSGYADFVHNVVVGASGALAHVRLATSRARPTKCARTRVDPVVLRLAPHPVERRSAPAVEPAGDDHPANPLPRRGAPVARGEKERGGTRPVAGGFFFSKPTSPRKDCQRQSFSADAAFQIANLTDENG